jgi:DNA-binding NtrC family response regulator
MDPKSEAELDRKVLHVDDDPAILAIVKNTLSKRGYAPHCISDPNLVVPWLAKSSTRIVLLDIDMPGKDGLALLRDIKKFDGGIQVIMLTGLVSMGTIIRATRMGAEECFFKPIENLDEVVDSVDRAYTKMLRWWKVLKEWRARKNMGFHEEPQSIECGW